jgi:hypothetical protein
MTGLKCVAVPFLSASLLGASAVESMAADAPPRPKTAEPVPSGKPTNKPMIFQNDDGTFTVQKVLPKNAQINNGLVIPSQVVVPMIPAIEKKQ